MPLLTISSAPFWRSVPLSTIATATNAAEKNQTKKQNFSAGFKDFIANVSFPCYGRIVEIGRSYQERLFWLLFHVTTLVLLIIFLWNMKHKTDSEVLTTTLFNSLYPIKHVAFPAISFCSINRISKQAALSYAVQLAELDAENRSIYFFYEQVKLLRYNYHHQDESVPYEQLLDFQTFLDTYDTRDEEIFYNTQQRMQMLTPSCDDLLVMCYLGNARLDCKREMQQTLTGRGFCCTYNPDGRIIGLEKPLFFVLNASTNDNLHKNFELDGFLVSIYMPDHHPDVVSSGVNEYFVRTGTYTTMYLSGTILETVPEARFLSPHSRNCYFEDEAPPEYKGQYNFNKCITRCRVESIWVLCRCDLFTTMEEFFEKNYRRVYCTLQHVECLQHYNFKWLNVITKRENVSGLEREMQDALYCPQCLPSCSETRFTATPMSLPLNELNLMKLDKYYEANNTNFTQLTIIADGRIPYYRQILKNSWFEILSNVGSICGIVTGFSLIGVCEFFYFLINHLFQTIQQERKSKFKTKMAEQPLLILP